VAFFFMAYAFDTRLFRFISAKVLVVMVFFIVGNRSKGLFFAEDTNFCLKFQMIYGKRSQVKRFPDNKGDICLRNLFHQALA
jgi:hypothetical protein